jgi:hypothetical protein
MRPILLFSTVLTATAVISSYALPQSQAIQLQDGTVYFAQPPRLLKTTTTYNTVGVWGATYYFTLSLPENAGEPLQKVTINQHQGVDNIQFDLKNSVVFTKSSDSKQEKLEPKDTNSDHKKRSVTLIFDPPISPGKTITIGIKPFQNPLVDGVYLFGVTAFPLGEKSHGQFLGYGRLTFYSRSFDSFFLPYGR